MPYHFCREECDRGANYVIWKTEWFNTTEVAFFTLCDIWWFHCFVVYSDFWSKLLPFYLCSAHKLFTFSRSNWPSIYPRENMTPVYYFKLPTTSTCLQRWSVHSCSLLVVCLPLVSFSPSHECYCQWAITPMQFWRLRFSYLRLFWVKTTFVSTTSLYSHLQLACKWKKSIGIL